MKMAASHKSSSLRRNDYCLRLGNTQFDKATVDAYNVCPETTIFFFLKVC